MGDFAPPSPLFKNAKCVRETAILVEQFPRKVLVCDHAGLEINTFSLSGRCASHQNGQTVVKWVASNNPKFGKAFLQNQFKCPSMAGIQRENVVKHAPVVAALVG